MNIKELAPKLYHSEAFVLASVQFLAIKDVLGDYAKNSNSHLDHVAVLKEELKRSQNVAIGAMCTTLTPEEVNYFAEYYPSLARTYFAKYLHMHTKIRQDFQSLYEVVYNYNVHFVLNDLKDSDIDEYKQNAASIRKYFHDYYNW
jgi:hypothetical protein